MNNLNKMKKSITSRHHIFNELCADCLEHCSFEEEMKKQQFKTIKI
jgi:hypothetical protein